MIQECALYCRCRLRWKCHSFRCQTDNTTAHWNIFNVLSWVLYLIGYTSKVLLFMQMFLVHCKILSQIAACLETVWILSHGGGGHFLIIFIIKTSLPFMINKLTKSMVMQLLTNTQLKVKTKKYEVLDRSKSRSFFYSAINLIIVGFHDKSLHAYCTFFCHT